MSLYTRDFQFQLLAHLAKDEEFFRRTAYLRLEDFELTACQLVLETLRDYYAKFRKLPDFNLLQTHIGYMLYANSSTMSHLAPEEMQTLAYIMEVIASTVQLNTAYYAEHLPQFLKFVRTTQIMRDHADSLKMGRPVDDILTKIAKANADVGTKDEYVLDSILGNPEPIMTATQFKRIPTGLTHLNKYTAGGLGLGELGMIVACPGVGKTTSLINMQVHATQCGIRTLFLTLELSAKRIKHRYQAIMGHVPGSYLKKPLPTWPEEVLARYARIVDPSYNWVDYPTIVDMSKRRPSLADIERMAAQWIEAEVKKNHAAEECMLMLVDWADYVDPAGITLTKQTREDVVLTKILEGLGQIGRKLSIGVWTATQGTRAADGVENLEMKHTAGSYHKNDPVDVSLGLGAVDAQGRDLEAAANDDDNEEMPACDRDLRFNIMKNRDNPPASFPIYQGATLRHWNSREQEIAVEAAMKEGKLSLANQMLKVIT